MELPDNYFRDRSPADIIAKVATITLANISLLGSDELKRIGWLNNPIIDILYSMTSAGVWIARTDTSGQQKVVEASGASIATYSNIMSYGIGVNRDALVRGYASPTDSTSASAYSHRIGMLAMTTDGAGAMAATAIATGPAGYYPVVKLLGVWSPTIEASTEFAFTVTGGALVGPSQINLALVAYGVTTIAPYGCPVYLYNLTDASAINIAIANGNATTTHYLIYEYWYET